MAILPGLDNFAAKYGYTENEKKWIAVSSYTESFIVILVLAGLSYNIWTILIK